MKSFNKKMILTFVLVTLLVTTSFSQQYGWRGPGRTGVYNEKGLMKAWPASGPSMLWEATGIGSGYSSATVTNDDIYITGTKGEKEVLTAFSGNGEKKWEIEFGNITKECYLS